MELIDAIKKNKPKLSETSIKTYVSILTNLFKKYGDGDFDIKWFNNQDDIIDYLSDVKPNVRKTIYSALISITDDKHNKKYRHALIEDGQAYNNENMKQEKTDAQKLNWISQEDILEKYNKMLKGIRGLWTKPKLTKQEYQKLQDVILLAITSGIYIPPRRSMDWSEFVIREPTDNDNYIRRNELHFNHYKGSHVKGKQIVKAPPQLMNLLKKFIKINPNKYLLVDSQNKKMSSVKINQHLERIFNKKVGINILRHSYISNKYPIFNVQELNKDAVDMGTSPNMMIQTYIKKE